METILKLNATEIVAILTALGTLVSSIIALIKHIKAKNYSSALGEANNAGDALMNTIEEFKTACGKAKTKPIMSDLSSKLETMGLKKNIDKRLEDLGLNK